MTHQTFTDSFYPTAAVMEWIIFSYTNYLCHHVSPVTLRAHTHTHTHTHTESVKGQKTMSFAFFTCDNIDNYDVTLKHMF